MKKLDVVQIADAGVPNQERVHLSVNVPTSLVYFVALKSYMDEGGVASGGAPAYWFPSISVRPRDQIVLYTGIGTNTSQPTPQTSGTTTHFLYWGMTVTLFNSPLDTIVLMELREWQAKGRAETESVLDKPIKR